MVDAWLMYTGATTYTMHPEPELDQQEFYFALTEELRERESDLQNHTEESILHKKKYRSIIGAR